MQIRPGHSRSGFIDRCTKELNDCILTELGDWQTMICGQRVCSIFDCEEPDKFDFGNGPAQVTTTLKLYWLKSDMPNVRAGDEVTNGGKRYTIKSGYPIDMKDCWLMAELSTCETC